MKLGKVFRGADHLWNIERAAIGDRCGEGGKLHRRHAKVVAVAGHVSCRRRACIVLGKIPWTLAWIIDPCPLTQPVVSGIEENPIKPQESAQHLEEGVVGASHRLTERHRMSPRKGDLLVGIEDLLAKCRQPYDHLDCRARLDRISHGHPLVDRRQDSAVVRVHNDNRSRPPS